MLFDHIVGLRGVSINWPRFVGNNIRYVAKFLLREDNQRLWFIWTFVDCDYKCLCSLEKPDFIICECRFSVASLYSRRLFVLCIILWVILTLPWEIVIYAIHFHASLCTKDSVSLLRCCANYTWSSASKYFSISRCLRNISHQNQRGEKYKIIF